MSKGQKLRALVNERLTAAAAEIFELFERTIAEYEQEVLLLKQRNHKQLQQLEKVSESGVQTGSMNQEEEGPSLEPPHLKEEEPEQEPEEFPFHIVTVKTEDDEDKSSVLHQRATEENREETNGEDCGAEAGCSSDPLTQLHSDSEEHTDSSSDTDHSEDYSQEQAPSKRSYAMISPDSSVTDVGGTDRPYRCSEYGKRFLCNSDLQKHMLVHTGERPFKCSVCEKCFKQKFHLVTHLRVHSGEKPFRCSVCEKAFTENYTLKRHMRTHTEDKPYVCSVCEKGFKQKFDLTQHLKRLHHICPVCEKAFVKDCDLKEHLRTHVEDGTLDQSSVINPDSSVTDVGGTARPHRCSECGKRFECNSALQRHMLVHTGEQLFKCSVCEKRFKQKGHLDTHLRVHTGEKRFKCSVCEKGFTEKGNLKAHMRTHTGEKPYVCSVCEKGFIQKSVLTRHLRVQHYICPVCNRGFVNDCNLKEHMETHVGDGTLDQSSLINPDSSVTDVKGNSKPYRCSECGKRFKQRTDLQSHRLIHAGQRPHKCPVCFKCFKWKSHLNEHMIIHTGEKPYSCSICRKDFTRNRTLREHMRTHSAELNI